MRFVSGGPDVSDNPIHAHEKGEVVFFCGAGISEPAGLPLFPELAKNMLKVANVTLPNDYENNADSAFLALERELFGKRKELIELLWDALNIKGKKNPQKHYHESLLKLATSRTNRNIRLVTTNFDRIFLRLPKQKTGEPLIAPRLPKPSSDR